MSYYNRKFLGYILACLLSTTFMLSSCKTVNSLAVAHSFALKIKKLSSEDRSLITKIAQRSIGKHSITTPKRSFRADCSGTIRGIFFKAQIPLGGILKTKSDNDVKAIYRFVRKYGEIIKNNPQPGDLVFFHNTYDRSRNGHMNDALTHIGIVEKVEGTLVHFIHHLGRSIIRSRLDLSKPKMTIDPTTQERINHILRRAQGAYPPFMTAQLFAGFGRL